MLHAGAYTTCLCEYALQAQLLALTSGTVRELRQSKLRLDSSLASLVDRSQFEAPEPRQSRSTRRGAAPGHLGKAAKTTPSATAAAGGSFSFSALGGGGGAGAPLDAAQVVAEAPPGSTLGLDARLSMLDGQLPAGSTAQAALG